MENDTEKKQKFLRKEILNKGYDADEFYSYLIENKGEEAGDVNFWLKSDLEKIVKEFQMKYNPKNNNDNLNENKELNNNYNQYPILSKRNSNLFQNSVSKQNNAVPPAINKEKKNNEDNIDDYYKIFSTNPNDNFINNKNKVNLDDMKLNELRINYNQDTSHSIKSELIGEGNENFLEIYCKKDDNGALTNINNIKIKICFPEKKVTSGIFKKTTTLTFNIYTLPLKFSVRREYSDFEWLRKIFLKLYPGSFIPPIPLKTLSENSDDKKIEKRMRALEKFLNDVINYPLLKNSNLIYDFLSIEKENEFKECKIKYDNINMPNSFYDMQNNLGKILIEKDIMKNVKYFDEIKNNISSNKELLNKLISSYKNLFKEMKIVSNRMLEISDLYKNIYDLSTQFNENENMLKSYNLMEFLMQNWGYSELQSTLNIDLEVKEYFKYVNLQYNAINELFDKYESQKNLYYKSKQKLLNKKEELFKKKDINKWELSNQNIDLNNKEEVFKFMLPNETKNVDKNKFLLFYFATCLKNEFHILREKIGIQNLEIYKQFYNKNIKVIEELNNTWMVFKNL